MWPRLINTALGIWLMCAPVVLAYGKPLSTSDYIVGPLVASIAIMAIWDVLRSLRWLNVAFGTWVVVAPWLLGAPFNAALNGMVTGAAIATVALVRGRIGSRYDGGWLAAFRRRSRA